ncbi:CLIP-associated protein-like isoform X1 [Phoenix dactylifera]|uniref:CLIP-associated protein-like isoform X1 n=1 Tax=Phoenix dactylifera TaxID=42345 RepID=A0A8B7D0L7_PHODC|nr:CLIP-associated protein-like isoform X1 [Phoenix dactylifera]
MEEAMEMARAKDTKERMAGVERLHQLLESSTKSLSSAEVTALVDCCTDLLKDSNFRVSQGALQALSSAAVLSGEHFKIHFNGLVPAVVERLGDGKQPVRDAARQLLITLMEVSSPTIIVERAGSYAWMHKSWRVREEFARTVTTAVGLFASTELTLQRVLLPPVLQLLNDPNHSVREAATLCIEELYTNVGPQFREELQRYHLPSSMMKEMNARLEKLEPKVHPSDGVGAHFISTEMKSFTSTQKRNSPKTKSIPRESLFAGGETDVTEKPVDPIKVYSEKELIREIEKITSALVPEKDWSLRIAAMQRVEGLVFGGAADYPSFPMLLKQLVTPLSAQLSDRRSSIVKQACHLLCLLSKELLGDFEACAEMFIPVLFKLVVITVLVIAESADNCIKTMLRNCKVARVLPRIADTAKNDRSAVLRARCCEYALLILEYWADAPEIQRSADLYEDVIKCCVADAMSEVRSTARSCYRMFTKTWPERSRRLFSSFDPVIQRIINDEDGGMHKRYASPSLRERGTQLSRAPIHASTPSAPGYGTSAIVAMDRSASIASGTSFPSGSLLLSQSKPLGKGSERRLESMLHASKQKVSAIESLLRGVNISEKHNSSISHSTSLDLGVDAPSARDPPFPLAVPASSNLAVQNPVLVDSTTANTLRGGIRNGGSNLTVLTNPQVQASRDLSKFSYATHLSSDSLSALSLPYMKRSSERLQEGSALEDNADVRLSRRSPNMHIDRQYHEAPYRDSGYRDLQSNYVPNFQRPLLRKQVTGRASASGRNSFDDGQISMSEMSSYMDGPTSLNDALTEGLSPGSDWVARVSAFSYLRTLLQQGPKGIQEVTQSFEKVMKLFFRHLDDPHHKVAQAALSTLAEIIPACRKHFESYLERILPHVFSRLIDQKELVRQPSSTTLEIVGSTYSIDSLLPALLRSLDEQRSPKAKLAVIQFANNSFNKYALNSDGCTNSGFLKLWLAKLVPLVNDKNTKLKEASISGIISIYSHFDSTAVLNFILSLSVEDQNSLRRALKQYTPRIEVDLVNFLQNKKERQRSKSFYDQSDNIGTSSEEGYVMTLKKGPHFGRYSAGSVDSEGGRKWNSVQESTQPDASIVQTAFDETQQHSYQTVEVSSDTEVLGPKISELKLNTNSTLESAGSRTIHLETDRSLDRENSVTTPCLDINRLVSFDGHKAAGLTHGGEIIQNIEIMDEKLNSVKNSPQTDNGPSIPQLLHQICHGNNANSSVNKREALQQLIEASVVNDSSIWMKYFNQILTAVLEVLDDTDSSTRELALSLIVEMLKNQKEAMEDSVEIVIEKLLHVTKDMVAKISNEAQQCLNIVLAQYDPFRCLSVVVPLLVSDDEKTLVICINCLTKLVGRLSQEELMTQLPSFLPALFDAFGNQSPDVRKTVVFCLVDIYIMLGKAFLPYLEGLSSTQLRLVTIYANRISQARSGAPIGANH